MTCSFPGVHRHASSARILYVGRVPATGFRPPQHGLGRREATISGCEDPLGQAPRLLFIKQLLRAIGGAPFRPIPRCVTAQSSASLTLQPGPGWSFTRLYLQRCQHVGALQCSAPSAGSRRCVVSARGGETAGNQAARLPDFTSPIRRFAEAVSRRLLCLLLSL